MRHPFVAAATASIAAAAAAAVSRPQLVRDDDAQTRLVRAQILQGRPRLRVQPKARVRVRGGRTHEVELHRVVVTQVHSAHHGRAHVPHAPPEVEQSIELLRDRRLLLRS